MKYKSAHLTQTQQ